MVKHKGHHISTGSPDWSIDMYISCSGGLQTCNIAFAMGMHPQTLSTAWLRIFHSFVWPQGSEATAQQLFKFLGCHKHITKLQTSAALHDWHRTQGRSRASSSCKFATESQPPNCWGDSCIAQEAEAEQQEAAKQAKAAARRVAVEAAAAQRAEEVRKRQEFMQETKKVEAVWCCCHASCCVS